MKVNHYVSRLQESSEFKKFIKENPKAKLCAGFFVLDFEGGKDLHQIDYILPNKKVATFNLDEGVTMKLSEQKLKTPLPEIGTDIKTDLDIIRGLVEDEMKNQIVTDNIKKIIAILHIVDGRLIWNLQCILNGLSILHIHINDSDKNILKFEKHSLLEFIKKA